MSKLKAYKPKNKQSQSEPVAVETKPIDANVLIKRLSTLNLQAKEIAEKRNQHSKAIEQLNVQLLAFGGAIEQIELMLQESGLNIETVYQQMNAEIASQKQKIIKEGA